MDRILNSGRLCNTCRFLQVANITHVLAQAETEILPGGHVSLRDGDKEHVANLGATSAESNVWEHMVSSAKSC